MRVATILLISLLSGCATVDTSKIAPGYTEAYIAINRLIFGYPQDDIPYQVIDKIPYASAMVNIGNGPSGLMILQESTTERKTWISADDIYLVTSNGRIIRTAGLENNLIYASLPNLKSIFNDNNLEIENFIYYSYDFPKLNNLKLTSVISFIKKEEVDLRSGLKKLRLYEEIIYSNKLGWRVKNLYWVDDNNFIWKSKQHVSPLLPKIEIEVTKKPS